MTIQSGLVNLSNTRLMGQLLIDKVRSKGGYGKTILSLTQPEGNAILDQVAEAMIRIIGRTKPSIINCPDNKWRKDYELYENMPRRITSLRGFKPFLLTRTGQTAVDGEYMVWHARITGTDYSQEDAEYLLEHQEEIPSVFERFVLVFPGTQWLNKRAARSLLGRPWILDRHLREALSLPYLYCDKDKKDKKWSLHFDTISGNWLDDGYNPGTRLVCPDR